MESRSVIPAGMIILMVVIVGVVLTPKPVSSSGQLAIRLVNYTNTAGVIKLDNGTTSCCGYGPADGGCDASLCDPQFELCVTSFTKRRSCEYFKVTSKVYRNSEQLNFLIRAFNENELGNGPLGANHYLTNSSLAIASQFIYWDGGIYITLRVMDSAQTQRYLITEISRPYLLMTPAQHDQPEWRTIILSGDGVNLAMDISIQCDQGFRDMYCLCEDIDTPFEHTKCTRDGSRVCLEGWAEPPGLTIPIKCLMPTIPCSSGNNPCRNNGTCGTYNDGSGTSMITCSCLAGFAGQYCETEIATTSSMTTTTRSTAMSTSSTPKPISIAKITTQYTFMLSEDAPIGTILGVLDNEPGLEYSLSPGQAGQPFTISRSGLVTAVNSLDREERDQYLLHAVARDPNNPTSKATNVSIIVTIMDVNDNAPVFLVPHLFVTIPESTLVGTTVSTVQAVDVDIGANGEVHFEIRDSTAPFDVTAKGEIMLVKSLSALQNPQSTYEFVVEAIDNGNPPQINRLTVTIRVLQDSLKFSHSSYVCRVADNVAVGTVVLTVQASSSGGSGKITYEIEDQLSKLFFQINDQGEIIVTRALAGFSLDSFEMSIAAYSESRDPNRKAVTKVQFTIVHTPTFEKPGTHEVTIRSDLPVGSIVDQLHAQLNGKRSHEIRYIATGDATASSYFTVDSSSGLITVARSLLSGTETSYNLSVEAVNSVGGSSSVVVAITVKRNLFAPVFVVPHYQVTIRVNHTTPVGSIVYTVAATDRDAMAPQNVITYSIIGDDEAKNFLLLIPTPEKFT